MSSRKALAAVCFVAACTMFVGVSLAIVNQTSDDELHLDAQGGFGPISPPPSQPSNVVRLTAAEQLGKDIFFDHTLSSPTGYSCATCHVPETGFTGPHSDINLALGAQPGVVKGRFGHRKPQAVPYSTFSPYGPYYDADLEIWLGGNFWDGRAPDNAAQARMPFLDQDEMANIPTGAFPPHAGGYSALLVQKLHTRPYATLFRQVFGHTVFANSADDELYTMVTMAVAAYEASAEVNQFSSKYDYSEYGVPASKKYKLTKSETNGMNLFFGQAQCSACHSGATLDPVLAVTGGKDSFTMYCYANIGVPRNAANPFYAMTSNATNPVGFNPDGPRFIDYGIGANPNPAPGGTTFYNIGAGDMMPFRGLFKAPSVRNVDKRPTAQFVKAYMHNGVFKSLEQVVNFYNKRNIAVDAKGNEVAFDLAVGPPAGFTPLFAPPEVADNVQNSQGVSPDNAGDAVSNNGQVGNLGLTPSEETDVVNFLKILTDGYGKPNPAPKP